MGINAYNFIMTDFNFGKNLKEIRKANHLTQAQVAELLHCSINKYASWEQGRTEPDIESLWELCKIFNVNYNDLLIPINSQY